jgi:hypothetical protein
VILAGEGEYIMVKLTAILVLLPLFILSGCQGRGSPLVKRVQELDGFPEDAILVSDLYAHPDQYEAMAGQTVTIAGYLDFANIHDLRDANYPQEAIRLVKRPEDQVGAGSGLFVYFPASTDPHPLFDRLYSLESQSETDGLVVAARGVLESSEMHYNFNSATGFVLKEADPDDVLIFE